MSSPTHGFRSCPTCGDRMTVGPFDLTVCRADGEERDFFGISGAMCPDCGLLALDRDTEGVHGFGPSDVVYAIASDSCLRAAGDLDAA